MKLAPAGQRGWPLAGLRILAVLASLGGVALAGGFWITSAPGESFRGALPPLTDAQRVSAARLRADVAVLAAEIGPRDAAEHPTGLARAERHVRAGLREAGYTVERLPYEVGGRAVSNLEAVLPGAVPTAIVVGAHYDSVPTTPGADDNASGTAILLELARALSGRQFARTVRFAAFVNEEPPYFKTGAMGSLVYARKLAREGVEVAGMLSLETLGYYDARPETQRYPPGLSLFYPSTGDFVAFVGLGPSRPLVRRATALFRGAARFPSEAVAAPGFVQGVDYSDHWSFAQVGVPAVMVTDTAFLRNARYHEPTDTAETLDYERMARVAEGLAGVVEGLAGATSR